MSEARMKKPDAPPTGSVTSTSSRVDPPSDESFTSSQQQERQSQLQLEQQQDMQRQQQRTKSADNKNAVYNFLQASKNVPRKHGTQVSAEEQAQLNEYCNHVLAQNSSVVEPSFLGSETEESGNLDHLQILSVNEHCLAGTLFRSLCSSTSMYCGDAAQVDPCCSIANTGFRRLPINGCDERKTRDNGTKVHPPTGMALDEYRDDCYDALEECDFKCAMNSDYAAVMEGDHNMVMNRDYAADIEENHHIMEDLGEDLGEVQPVQYPHISPLSSGQQDISNRSMSFLHLKPVESIFSSMTTESAMIQPSTQNRFHTGMEYRGNSGRDLRRRKSDTSENDMHMVAEIPVPTKGNDGGHGEQTEVDDRAQNVPAVDAQGAAQQTKTVKMDDESNSSKPCITRVEIHMDECEIDVEWKKGSVKMGGSENGSTSSLESEDRDDGSANDPNGNVRSGTSTNSMRSKMAGEEEKPKSTHLPFFVTPRLFIPSDSGDESRSCSSSLSSHTPKSGAYNTGSVTTRSYPYMTTDASGSKHCSKHVKTSFLTMWSSGFGSPPQSPCHHRPCDTPTPPPMLQGPTEHLLPYQTDESSGDEEMYQDVTSASASSRPRTNRKATHTRKIPVQRGRSRESRSTGSGSNVTDPEGEVTKSTSFHCVDTSEPEGDLQISSSYHFGESSPSRSVTRHRPKTQNQSWSGGNTPLMENHGRREPDGGSPMNIIESKSGEGTFITGGTSTSSCQPKSTSHSEIMNSPQSPYHSSFSAFQSSQSNQSQDCYSDDMIDDSSESPSQILSDVLRNESNDELSQSSFTGNSSIDFMTDRSYLSPTSPTSRCFAYLDGGNILDPSTSYGNSVATHEKTQRAEVPSAPKNEGSRAFVGRGCQEENQNGKFMLDELVMGTFSTDKMTDTGGSTECTSLAESKKNSLDKLSSSNSNNNQEKCPRNFAEEGSEEVDKEMRGITFLANERHSGNGRNDELPVVHDKNLFNLTPLPRQAPKCPSPLQKHASRKASCSSEEWANSESSESSLILDDSSSYSSHEDNLVISDPHEELSTSDGLSSTAMPPSESVATLALAQPYSIASLQVASLDTKLEKQEYPLVSSLIRKVGSYDAQIIADKTRRQLLRTAQSQERLSSGGSASELGSTSISNRDTNLHAADDGSDNGGSQFHASPAGRSLITMFSDSSSSCSSSPSKAKSTSAESYHTAAEHVMSPTMVNDSESEISITSIQSKEPTVTHPGMTAEQNFGKEQIIGGSQDEQVEVHITANETDLELAASSFSGRQSQRNQSPVAALSMVDKDDEDQDQNNDASSSSSGRDSLRNQSPVSVERSKVIDRDDEHQHDDDDDQDQDHNNGGDDDYDDQLSLSTTSQHSDAEQSPCLALSSVSDEDSQSEIIGYDDPTTSLLAASQDAPSTDAQNNEAAQEEETMQSSQQRKCCNHVLARMKRLVAKCKPRSESTLLEPLLPRTIHNLDETALWQIRYNLEPPVDSQFHDDLLYIIEEGHLASRSTYMLGQGQARSVCSRIVRKFCELGGFWYFFGLAFLVSALISIGMVGLGI